MHTVGPYLSRPPITVPDHAPLSVVQAQLVGPHRHVVVVDDHGRLAGVVREARVRAAAGGRAVATDLLDGALVVSELARLADAVEALARNPEDIVVAVDEDGVPIGVFTEEDGVRLAAELLGDTPTAGEVGRREVITVGLHDTVGDARRRMRDAEVRHLVVMEPAGIRGVVSERDLVGHEDHPERPLAELGIAPVVRAAPPDRPLRDVARTLYTRRIGCVPLLEAGALVGIVTRTDALRALLALDG